MAKQVKVYIAKGDFEEYRISKAGTSYGSALDFIENYKAKGSLIETVLETRAGLELRIFEDVAIETTYFSDDQVKELEKYLTKVRDKKMNIVAFYMGKKKYTDAMFTKPNKIYSYRRDSTGKYYIMVRKAHDLQEIKPLKVEIRTIDDLLL